MSCTLCAFVSLIWLREQIVHGGQGLDWWRELAEADEEEEEPAPAAENAPPEPAEAANPPEAPAAVSFVCVVAYIQIRNFAIMGSFYQIEWNVEVA